MRRGMVLVAVLVVASGIALADEQIKVGGVPGGVVWTIHRQPTMPSHVFAGVTGVGVFASTNGGASWGASILPGIEEHTVNDLVVSSDGTVAGCGTRDSSTSPIVFSSNGGATWARATFPQDGGRCLSIARGIDGTFYAGVDFGGANGFFKSADGRSWTATPLTLLSGFDVAAILQLPSGRLLAGTRNCSTTGGSCQFSATQGGLEYSDDGGTTWNIVSSIPGATLALGRNPAGFTIGVFDDPTNSQDLVETSVDGATWIVTATISWLYRGGGFVEYHAASDTFFVMVENAVYQTGTGPGYVLGSTNLAASLSGYNPYRYSAVSVDPANVSHLLLSELLGDGVFATTNGGTSWSIANRGLGAQIIDHAIKDHTTGYRYAASTFGNAGLFFSSDFTTFKTLWRPIVNGDGVYGLTFDVANPARVLITTENGSTDAPSNIPYLRLLGDSTTAVEDTLPFNHTGWTTITPPGPATGTIVSAMLVDGANFTVGLAPLGNTASNGQYLYRSTNSGANWSQLNLTTLGGIRALAFGATTSEIWAGAGDAVCCRAPGPVTSPGVNGANGLFHSMDGGTTWSAVGTSMPFATESPVKITVDPANGQRVWILTLKSGTNSNVDKPTQIYETLDGGTTWTDLSQTTGPVSTVRDLVYVASEDKVVVGTGGPVGGFMHVPGAGIDWLPAFQVYGQVLALYNGSLGAGSGSGLFEITGLGLATTPTPTPSPTPTPGGGHKKGCGCDLAGDTSGAAGAVLAVGALAQLLVRRRKIGSR